MKHALAFATLLLAGLFSTPACADTVTIQVTYPTQNVDNSAIPATGAGSLTTLRIEYGTCNADNTFNTKVGEVSRTAAAAGVVTTETLNLQPGKTCVRVHVGNTYAVESPVSNVTTRTVLPPQPKAPTIASTAYPDSLAALRASA